MSITTSRIVPCLWFDSEAEEAATFYTSIFPNSKIGRASRYGEAGREFHGKEPSSVLTIEFELDGVAFTALNGGPIFKFTEAISLQVMCDSQEEIDYYWDRLMDGGGSPSQCGWLKDRFGLSWQVCPTKMAEWMTGSSEATERTMGAMFTMHKLDMAVLEAAYQGR
ncbi:VOC family protein [Aeoliella sp. SH292]|uniref:VOC family protein n=1 Tax=Aeoliella sp. SH292 TaxID=3454464 RepID=UPI003F980206